MQLQVKAQNASVPDSVQSYVCLVLREAAY